MNSNKLTGKEIAVVISALIIGVAGVACMGYGITLINETNSTPSWDTNDVEQLKAAADADYWEQMQKYTNIQGAAGQSITETATETTMVGAVGQTIVETATETIMVGAAGQTMVIKK